MGIPIADNFNIQMAKPLDGRIKYDTLAEMAAMPDSTLYDGCIAYCVGEDKNYQWKSTNTVDADTGKWREFETGGGSSEATVLTGTLTVSGWSNKSQTVTITGMTASTNGVAGLLNTATDAQISAAATAKIKPTTQGTNSLTFTCDTTPSIDIPFGVLIGGGSSSPVILKSFSSATEKEITTILNLLKNGMVAYQDLVDAGWTVGSERTVTLSSMDATDVGESHVSQDITLVILHGSGMFELESGGTNNFVIGVKDVLVNNGTRESGYMNPTDTNVGGWDSCARRTWCNNTFKNAFPLEVQSWFKRFKTKTADGNSLTTITESTDWFALNSFVEISGSSSTPYVNEGIQMDYYKTSDNRVKKANNQSTGYWLRSPDASSSTNFKFMFGQTDFTANASDSSGFSPFGCI